MSDPNIPPTQFSHELHIMISGHTKSSAAFDHAHCDAQHFGNMWFSIYEYAQKEHFVTLPMFYLIPFIRRAICCLTDFVTQFAEQGVQLIEAAMDVANDIEWSMFMLAVIPQRLALNYHRIHFFR